MKMTKVLLTAVLAMTGAVTGCGAADGSEPSDGSEQQDVVAFVSSEAPQQQLYDLEVAPDASCTSSQFLTVMDHCQDHHASIYTCCRITSCRLSDSGYLVYTWNGTYAC